MIAVLLAQVVLAQLPIEAVACETRTRTGMDQVRYVAAQAEQKRAGYRLARETVDDDAGRPRFAALWVRDGKPQEVSRGAHGVDAFYFASLEMTRQDYRLVDLTVGVVAGSPYFSALWVEHRPVQQAVAYWIGAAELRSKLAQPKQRVLAIAPYRIGTVTYYAALFDVGADLTSAAAIGLSASALDKRDAEWRRRGYMLSRSTPQPGRPGHFAAVWRKADGLSACEREMGKLDPVAQTLP